MRVLHVSAPIPLRLAAAIAVGVAVAASGCTTSTSAKPPSSTSTSSTPPGTEGAIVVRIRLPGSPFSVATGEGLVWALTRQPAAAVWRIDPSSAVAETFHLGGNVSAVAFGFGSLWAAVATGELVRITPKHSR